MKQLLFTLIACLCFISMTFAQSGTFPKTKIPRIPDSQVPQSVLDKFKADHPGTPGNQKWYQKPMNPNNYLVVYHPARQTAEYIFQPPTQCTGIALNPASPTIAAAIATSYPNATVCCAGLTPDGNTDVALTTPDGRTLLIVIDSRGNIVSETQLL